MNLQTLKYQIQHTELTNNFLVFTGDEWQVQKIYIQQIAKVKHLKVKYIDSIADIYSSLGAKSLFQEYYCYVVRDDKDILTNEKLQGQLMSGIMGKNILILLVTNLDKRTKAFKTFEGININFDKLPLEQLKTALKRECNLSDKNLEKLIDICEYDYGRCLLEIDKLHQFYSHPDMAVDGNVNDSNDDMVFNLLLKTGTIYIPPKDAIFDLVDAILKHQIKDIYRLLNNCYDIGENNLTILSVLYDNAKQLLQVQSYEGNDLVNATGLTNWQIKNAKSRLNKYSNGELVNMLRVIRSAEKGIKIGDIEDAISVEYVLANVL